MRYLAEALKSKHSTVGTRLVSTCSIKQVVTLPCGPVYAMSDLVPLSSLRMEMISEKMSVSRDCCNSTG